MDKLEPLRPLTPQEQEQFDNRRETAAVVQTRCKNCGAWYETLKRSQRFTESFFCDCGTFHQFEVEPLSTVALGPAIDYSDPGARLDTGMKVRDVLANACNWWNKTGRHLMKNERRKGRELVSLDPEDPNYLPSGIVNGEPWDMLDRREKLTVAKHWHHFYVRKPQTL